MVPKDIIPLLLVEQQEMQTEANIQSPLSQPARVTAEDILADITEEDAMCLPSEITFNSFYNEFFFNRDRYSTNSIHFT